VVFAVAVFQDITARRQAQRELAELNAHLEDEIHRRTEALELTVRRLQREMTTRRHYESQLLDAKAAADRANRSKTMFLMNVSHELRTPLNHLIGFSDLLTERVADPDARRLAQTAAASGRELEEKVDDLLALARAEAEHPGADPVAFDADAMMLHLARQSGIVYTDSQSVGRFIGDEQAVRDILTTVFQRAVNEDEKVGAATSTVDSAGTAVLVVRIDSDRLSRRVRALAYLFGEDGAEQDRRFHQQEIDFKLAIARARARVLGGDITCPGDAASQTIVEVTLPFLARP
jgi:signal transduction histidine kinase